MAVAAPFPWFGGKRKVAPQVWARFGDVRNYVEPFFGSGAVLLGRPLPFHGPETVNDLDGFVCNAWRAMAHDPEAVESWCHFDWPQHECDLHARHSWLVQRKDSLPAKLEGDPDWYDAKIAGYWLWGLAEWIGSEFCGGKGPWHLAVCEDGTTQLLKAPGDAGQGVQRSRLHVGDAGQGVQRQLLHVGDAGRGVQRSRLHVGDAGRGVSAYFAALSERMHRVRVCCGSWDRVCGPSVTHKHGLTGVFLDPPYSAEASRDDNLYRMESGTVAHDVRAWCLANGDHPKMRIALCGYAGEGHEALEDAGWSVVSWNAGQGYAGQTGKNNGQGRRERVWFSPHCLPVGHEPEEDLF